MVEAVREPERAEQLPCTLPRCPGLGAAHQLRQHDVLDRIELRKQMVELIDEAEQLAPQPRAALVVEARRLFSAEPDRPFKPALDQTHRLQQSRLARSRWSLERYNLTA